MSDNGKSYALYEALQENDQLRARVAEQQAALESICTFSWGAGEPFDAGRAASRMQEVAELAIDDVPRTQAFILRKQAEAVQASREALEGEPVAVVDRVGIMQRLSPYTNLPEGTKLYTHPASAQAPEEIERDGINSTENLAYIDGYNDCAKEVRENARSNKQAASVPKHWRETMSDFQREERYVVFKLRDLVETEKDAVLRLANSINAQEIECVIVESDWPNYEHTWQTIERVSDGSYSDPYAEIERLQSRVAELEITHDGQAASVPK